MSCTDSPWRLLPGQAGFFRDFNLKSQSRTSANSRNGVTVDESIRLQIVRIAKACLDRKEQESNSASDWGKFVRRPDETVRRGKQPSPCSGETFLPIWALLCQRQRGWKKDSRRCQPRKLSSAGNHFSPITGHTDVHVTPQQECVMVTGGRAAGMFLEPQMC